VSERLQARKNAGRGRQREHAFVLYIVGFMLQKIYSHNVGYLNLGWVGPYPTRMMTEKSERSKAVYGIVRDSLYFFEAAAFIASAVWVDISLKD
jgi:hypothetical protein